MKNITKFTIAALAFASFAGHAQNRPTRQFGKAVSPCGSTEYETLLQQKIPSRVNTQQFEQWLAPKVASVKLKRLQKNGNDTNEVLTIPVVVHILHDGDAIGQNENIADEQVFSQITVLNQDFRKMENTPGYNTNPVGADTGIEFCLAKRDPQGFYTSGIKRYNLGKSVITMDEIEVLKTQTQWNPEKYLNIWIVRSMIVEGGMGLSGYAQFPTNSGIEGLDNFGLPTAANTDGVVLAYGCFGSEDIYPQGSYFDGLEKGRIAAHEIGHFLGLRHIWGDGFDCNASDFCDDTPVAIQANTDCPEEGWDSCPQNSGFDMIQNYMDYTSDSCKNIFTLDQKDRMLAVLANSPRRISLLTSDACVPGIVSANDGSLNILNIESQCSTSLTPQMVLSNTGNNAITVAAITYSVDDGSPANYNWAGNLPAGQQATLSLPAINALSGNHSLSVNLTTVNGTTDPNPANNTDSRTFTIAGAYNTTQIVITVQPDIFSDETSWRLRDSDGNIIASASSFSIQQTQNTISVNNSECYTFTIYDSMGDGICCTSGEGFYTVKTPEGALIAEGGDFTDMEATNFRIDTTLGNTVFSKSGDIKLYPNPANNILIIAATDINIPGNYIIYNNLGQVMDKGYITSTLQPFDIANYANGIYFIKVSKDNDSSTLQFIKH